MAGREWLRPACSCPVQDVIEIMRKAIYDKFSGLDDLDLGCTDYRRAGKWRLLLPACAAKGWP